MTRDHTSYERSRRTEPRTRNCTAVDAPVQSRLPSCQTPERLSASATRHARQRAVQRCACGSRPCRCRSSAAPSMLKCAGRGCRLRASAHRAVPPGRASRRRPRAPTAGRRMPQARLRGEASSSAAAGTAVNGADAAFALKAGHPLANTILTDDETPARRGLPRSRSRRQLGRGRASAATSRACSRSTSTPTSTRSRRTGSTTSSAGPQSGGYSAAVIVLDTPGGLEESMRKIVSRELSLKIPVIVYVSPGGARAASAGVWISQAADVLAMAPDTNIGSSTPINGNGTNISQRPAPQGRQRRGRVAARAREDARPQRGVGRPRGAQGVEPDRAGGAADERDRPDLAVAAGAAEDDRRPQDGAAQTSRCTPPARRSST